MMTSPNYTLGSLQSTCAELVLPAGHTNGKVTMDLRRLFGSGLSGALNLDALAVPGVAPPNHLIGEAALGGEILECARAAQQQLVIKRPLEVAVSTSPVTSRDGGEHGQRQAQTRHISNGETEPDHLFEGQRTRRSPA
jgi:hypothetical protein